MANTQQVGLVIIGILLGYTIGGMKGALIGGLISIFLFKDTIMGWFGK